MDPLCVVCFCCAFRALSPVADGIFGVQEYIVPTKFGQISVTVCGDLDKPALVTYPDVGLNCKY